jgi:uncharacterized protein YjiS (DUF1127 family)
MSHVNFAVNSPRPRSAALPAFFPKVSRWVLATTRLRRQRKQLAGLTTSALRDIGVSSAQARAEAARAPWDVPKNWKA